MREVELGLEVQLHRLRLHPLGRLPPGVGVAEGGVGHGPGQVGQEREAGVAFGALGGAAGQVGVGIRVGAVELGAVVAADGLRQDAATQRQVTHARVAGSALTARGHTCTKHLRRHTWWSRREEENSSLSQYGDITAFWRKLEKSAKACVSGVCDKVWHSLDLSLKGQFTHITLH